MINPPPDSNRQCYALYESSLLVVARVVSPLILLMVFLLASGSSPAVGQRAVSSAERVSLGVDVLQQKEFAPLVGRRVGLITNHTGLDSRGATTIDLLHQAENLELVRLFGPEHGLRGDFDQAVIDDGVDRQTGLPVVSLYGPRRSPTQKHLADLDALVFDIQDIGCRFYTYISTMKLAMKAAAAAKIEFVVLDRPNPINGLTIEGPMRDPGEDSFVAGHVLPVRHGMTIGELARMFAAESDIDVKLTVVPVEGWRREQCWDETGLVWTDPSPNMRSLRAALLYPGVGLLETTNLSVGRGTDTPFELFGAPWIDPRQLQAALTVEGLPGVRFVPRYFTPTASKFAGERCGGVEIIIVDRASLNSVDVGLTLAATLRRLYPNEWDASRYPRLLVHAEMHRALLDGANARELKQITRQGLDDFAKRRKAFLLY